MSPNTAICIELALKVSFSTYNAADLVMSPHLAIVLEYRRILAMSPNTAKCTESALKVNFSTYMLQILAVSPDSAIVLD